jgi:hypothetical protein
MKNIIEIAKDKNVSFEFLTNKYLWYKTETGLLFPVPIKECGDSSFLKKDKATLFLKYIREQLKKEIKPKTITLGIAGKGISFEYYRKGYAYYNIGEGILFPILVKNNEFLRKIEDGIKFFKEIKEFKENLKK